MAEDVSAGLTAREGRRFGLTVGGVFLALSIALGNRDFSVFEDIVDSNVNLPFLDIDSDESDSHRRMGSFSIGYTLEAH